MKPVLKKAGLAIGLLMLSLGIGLAGCLIFLQSAVGQDFIKARINTGIPGHVDWQSLQGALFPARLVLAGVRLNTPDGEPVVRVERAEIAVGLLPLARGEIRIPFLMLQTPELSLVADDSGRLNLTSVFSDAHDSDVAEAKESALAWPSGIGIDNAQIQSGRLAFQGPENRWQVALDRLELAGDMRFAEPDGELRLQIDGLGVTGPGLSTRLIRGDIGAVIQGDRLAPFQVELVFGNSRLALNGSLRNAFEDPIADLAMNAAVDLDELSRAIGLDIPLSGMLRADATVTERLNRPTVSLRVDYGGGLLGAYRLDGAELSTALEAQQLKLHRLVLKAGEGSAELSGEADLNGMFPGGLLAGAAHTDALTYQLSLKQENLDLSRIPTGSTRTAGVLSVTASLEGRGWHPERLEADLEVEAQARDLAVGDQAAPIPLQLNAAAELSPDRLHMDQLHLKTGDVDLEAHGTLNRSSREITGKLNLAASEIGHTLEALGLPGAKGWAQARTSISGALDHPVFDIDVQTRDLGYQDAAIGNLTLAARLSEAGMLHLDGLTVANRGSRIQGTGTLKLFKPEGGYDPDGPLALSLRMTRVNPTDFVPQSPVKGLISGTLDAEGILRQPLVTASVSGEALAAAGLSIGNAVGRLRFSEGILTAETIRIENRRSTLTLSGNATLLDIDRFAFHEDPAIRLEAESSRLHLDDFTETAQGILSLTARIDGTVTAPSGTAGLKGTDLQIADQPISSAALDLRLSGDRLYFEPLQIDLAPGESLAARGWLDRSKAYRIEMETRGIALSHLAPVKAMGRLAGILTASLAGEGKLDAPVLAGELSLSALSFDGQPLEDAALRLDIDAREARISGTVGFPVTAAFDLKNRNYRAAAEFRDTPLAPYLALAGRPELTGHITGSVTAEGSVDRLAQSRASVAVDSLGLRIDDTPVLEAADLHLELADGRYRVPETTLVLARDARLQFQGFGRLGGNLQLTADGEVPLEIAARFTDAIPDISGRLFLSATVTGTQHRPEGALTLRLADVGFTIPHLLQRIHNLNGEIRATPQQITLAGLRGALDSGTFEAGGTVQLDGLSPEAFDIVLVTSGLPIAVPDTLDLKLTGQLALTGSGQSPAVRGQIVLDEGLYYRDFKVTLMDTVERMRRPQAAPRPWEPPPAVSSTTLDVTVTGKAPLTVDNNVALLALDPDLRLSGTVGAPVISGRTDVLSGTIHYNKRAFTVTRGVVDFVDPYRIEPLFDVSAETDIREWTIVLDVTGPPDNLRFALSSSPPENDEDILSLLAFGKTSREMIAAESGAASMPKEMLASLVAEKLAADLKASTGIDSLEVAYEAGATAKEDDIRITVGKELSRRLSVRYGMDTKRGEAVQRVTTDYRLLERLVLSAFQDTAGDFGGELQFRIEFR